MQLDKIMNEPATRAELENQLSILNTLLPISEGRVKQLRLAEKEQLEIKLALFDNVAPEDEIIFHIEDESPRTIEIDTFDIRKVEIAVNPPRPLGTPPREGNRTANEKLADRHKFTSSLYRDQTEANQSQNPMEGIFLLLAGTY